MLELVFIIEVILNRKLIKHYFADGKVQISPKGSIKLGKVTLQRKGGDSGRPTANMLQFKIDPTELLDI